MTMPMRYFVHPLLIASLFGADVLGAQEAGRDTTHLQPLVITATRVPVAQTAPTTAVTVISGAELRDRGITSVADALRLVPGAAIAPSGSFGGTTSLFLRGGERDYVRVLVDGVVINQPGGEVDFAHLTTDNIERIEIVRGPTSVLYGSDAVSGVVQIFTRRGGGATTVDASARAGTWRTREGDLTAWGSRGRAGWSLGGGLRRTDGLFPFNSEYRNDVLSGSLRLDPDVRTDVHLTGRASDARFNYPTDFSGAPVDSNAFRTERQLVLGLDAGRYLSEVLEARILLGVTEADLRNDDRPDGDNTGGYISRNEIAQRSADARLNLRVSPAAVLTTGFEYRQQRDRNESASIFEGETYAEEPTAPRRFNRAAYVQALGDLVERVSYSLGARYDDNANFGEFFTYRVAGGVRMLENTYARASLGTAFKEPTIFENYGGGFVRGNPKLDPERSRSWEAGFEQRLLGGGLTLAATWFHQRFRDRIEFVMEDGVATYANVGSARAEGLELELRARPVAGVNVTGSFTALGARLLQADGRAGEQLLRRPRSSATLAADYRPGTGGGLGAVLTRVGERRDMNFSAFPAEPVALGSYTRVDAHGDVQLFQRPGAYALSATGRVENLLDEEYQTVYGFRTPGRTVLLGMRLMLQR